MKVIEIIFNLIEYHPFLAAGLYFHIGIIFAIIYSITVHVVNHQVDSDDEEFLGFVISFILFWPFLMIFIIPACLITFIKIIGEKVANVIERDE